jgi:type IV pilus assembly protein PilB
MIETTLRKLKRLQKTYKRGEIIFEQNDDTHELYVLINGEVNVVKEGKKIAVINRPNTFIGEIGALMKQPRSATCVSARASTLLRIPGNKIEEFFQMAPSIGFKLAMVLCERLDMMNKKYMKAIDSSDEDEFEG